MLISYVLPRFPRAGGQYNIIAVLSPPRYRAALSWFCTHLTVMGWIGLSASIPFLGSQLIQTLIGLNNATYEPQRWQGTCIYWAIILLAYATNIWGYRVLHIVGNVMMVLHVVFFIAVLLCAAILPPTRNSASFVFTEFVNLTGWDSDGLAWCLGMLTSAYTMIGKLVHPNRVFKQCADIFTNNAFAGYDSAMHLSEEMQRPEIGVPRAIVGSMVLNGVMGFALVIAILFGMGDLQTALATGTGYPIIEIFFFICRGNKIGATVLTCTIVVAASLATMGVIASSSRTIWAAARDEATPFSSWLSQLDSKQEVPRRAVTVTTCFLILIGLLNIASTTALNAILSLPVVALSTSYAFPIAGMLYRRLKTPEELNYGPWKLPGKLGIVVNIVALCYITFLSIFLFFPPIQPVTAVNMNYASLLYGAVVLFSAIGWFVSGRIKYKGPKALQY